MQTKTIEHTGDISNSYKEIKEGGVGWGGGTTA